MAAIDCRPCCRSPSVHISTHSRTCTLIQSQQINKTTPDPHSQVRRRHPFLFHLSVHPCLITIETKYPPRQHLGNMRGHASKEFREKTNWILSEGSEGGTHAMCCVCPWVYVVQPRINYGCQIGLSDD